MDTFAKLFQLQNSCSYSGILTEKVYVQLQILRVDRHTVMANLVYNAFMYLICDTPILQMKPECGISREATNEGICSQHIPPGKCEYCCTDQTTLTTYY